MIALDVGPEFYAMLGGLALAWSEYQHRRDEAIMRERIAALEVRVEHLELAASDELEPDPEPAPPSTRGRRK